MLFSFGVHALLYVVGALTNILSYCVVALDYLYVRVELTNVKGIGFDLEARGELDIHMYVRVAVLMFFTSDDDTIDGSIGGKVVHDLLLL